jgi:hypothetical protein
MDELPYLEKITLELSQSFFNKIRIIFLLIQMTFSLFELQLSKVIFIFDSILDGV